MQFEEDTDNQNKSLILTLTAEDLIYSSNKFALLIGIIFQIPQIVG
jgi:hypothetical protein